MNFEILQPSPGLAPYIKSYWMLNGCMHKDKVYHQRIVPNGFIELIFYYHDLPEYLRRKSTIKSKAVLSGQQDEYYDIAVSGNMQLFSIIFKPQSARLFFGIPASELYNQSIPAEYIFKDAIDKITEKLNQSKDVQSKVQIVEAFLLKQIVRNRDFQLNRITDSVGEINVAKGIKNIETLASRACLSRKQFERTFSDFVGIAPKKFLRVIRFQHAIYKQQIKSIESLSQLAHECGYYDQSHMINDFKRLTGLTPNQYFSDCEPFSDYFS